MARKLTKDQKRKKKRKELARAEQDLVRPYGGRKYRTEAYVPLTFATESAIREANVLCNRELDDDQVGEALVYLVQQLRGQNPEITPGNPIVTLDDGSVEDLIADNIRRHWKEHFATHPRLPTADLVGVLRTLLDSIAVWTWRGGYLEFLERFLAEAGGGIQRLSADELADLIERGELVPVEDHQLPRS